MSRHFVIVGMVLVGTALCAGARAAEEQALAGPTPTPIKVKMKGPRGNPKMMGLKRFASLEEIDKAFGEGEVTIEREVDFAKEDVLCVGRAVSPPANMLKWKSSAEEGITFFVEERPSKIRGHVVMVVDEWYTVPKGTKAVFGKDGR